jgi:glycosidase
VCRLLVRATLFLVIVFALLSGTGACSTAGEPTVPTRSCGLRVWHKPATTEARVQVIGDWDGWARPGTLPEKREDGWLVAAIDTTPGEHAYAIIEDGVWLTDKNEPMTDLYEGHEISVATAAECDRPAVRVDGVDTTAQGSVTVRATFVSARDGARVEPSSIVAKDRAGAELTVKSVDPSRGTVTLETSGLSLGKYTYTIEARDVSGKVAEDARATAWIDRASGKEPWDPRDAFVYQVMIDRFRGTNAPLAPPASPSSRAGGTLAGVRRALEAGDIEALGANAIWLSPLYSNPEGEFTGNDGRSYTSYHGYWPIASRGIDSRFATEAELDEFVRAAHARGIRVLFDVVPNHVHQQHPWATEHAAWFKQDCLCGQGSCDWGGHIRTCWFAPYLPDLDWTNLEAGHAATNDVLWWFDRWDADGIRIDAVPMMPRSATRRIAAAARTRYGHPGHALYVLGENFTGPGGYQSLRYDLGPHGLDGSFHFPLMWTLRNAIALETAPLGEIETSFRAGEQAWDGSNAVMGLMIGNHDVSRFASASAGNADGDAWDGPPQPLDPIVYAKQRLALASVLTLPGAPVVYYGDEVGLAGRSDPDCRRVMPADSALSEAQLKTRELARKIGRTRACSRPLRRGALRTILADEERLVFAREIDGESVIVALGRRPRASMTIQVPPSLGPLVDVVTGEEVPPGSLTISNDPFSVHVWVTTASGCMPQ